MVAGSVEETNDHHWPRSKNGSVCDGKGLLSENSNRPLEHTPEPQLPVYEGNPFIFVFWGTWGLFQGSVELFLDLRQDVLVEEIINSGVHFFWCRFWVGFFVFFFFLVGGRMCQMRSEMAHFECGASNHCHSSRSICCYQAPWQPWRLGESTQTTS